MLEGLSSRKQQLRLRVDKFSLECHILNSSSSNFMGFHSPLSSSLSQKVEAVVYLRAQAVSSQVDMEDPNSNNTHRLTRPNNA